jgi:hypothetical protein
MTTLEDEFQKPVRDRLDQIVIPDPNAWTAWDMPDLLGINQWYLEAQSFQDTQVELYQRNMNDIACGVTGSMHGEFPTPTPRKRTRKKKR